ARRRDGVSLCIDPGHRAAATRLKSGAQTRRKAAVALTVGPKPIHAEFPTSVAGHLEKADLEHHLLGRGDLHRIHDAAVSGRHAPRPLHGAVGIHRIAGNAAEHELAIAAADADAPAAGARPDLVLQVTDINGDLHVEDADQPHALIEHGDVGRSYLLALAVQHAV